MTLKALLRVRLAGLLSSLLGANRSRKRRTRGQILGFAALMLYAFGFLGFSMFQTFAQLAPAFSAFGVGWVYFAMAALMTFGLMFIGSVFTAKAQLYEATDNDLLLSMPIPPRDVLLSRLALLLVMDELFGLVVSVPAFLAWQLAAGFTLKAGVNFVLIFLLLLPLLALLLTALFGWLLHLAAQRVRSQSLLTVLLSLAFIAVYFVVVQRMNIWLAEMVQDPSPLVGALGGFAPLLWLGRACADGSLSALGLLALADAALCALGWTVLERSFLRTATDRRAAAKIRYVEKKAELLSPDRALLQRELRRLGATPMYLLNGAFGTMLAPFAAVFLLLRRELFAELLAQPGLGELLTVMGPLALCFLGVMTMLTAPSISLEGKSLWLLQSMPVSPRQVLRSKLRLHLLIGLPPTLLLSAALAALLPGGPLMKALCVALPALSTLFSGLLGLFENLRHPYLDWVNETQAVKSGSSVVFTMLISMALLSVPLILGLVFLGDIAPELLELGFGALLALLCGLLTAWLRTRGEQRFMEI
ncbi:MAG: hypothetical protein K6G17_06495 [Oscillospiraceae bacterium]|nr:hypothetical protein [Oscillospiraceae bacterium]